MLQYESVKGSNRFSVVAATGSHLWVHRSNHRAVSLFVCLLGSENSDLIQTNPGLGGGKQ